MIRVDNVTKFYGTHAAVKSLDFEISEGECVGFLGLNGAGKTTTLRLLSCLLLPTSGRIHIRDLDVEQNPHEIRKFIGFLPDTPPLYPEMSVRRFLEFAGQLRSMSAADLRRRMPEVLQTCALETVAELPIHTLSHGYKQRVGIAQAIVHEPDLLILDEPIQGLDPVQIVQMREMIRRLRGKHTILLSTHILFEIQQTCDRILILNDGQIAAQGTEDELLREHRADIIVDAELRLPGCSDAEEVRRRILETFGESEMFSSFLVSSLTEERFAIEARADADLRAELASGLVSMGAGLLRLDRRASGLESMFVELSGHDETRGES